MTKEITKAYILQEIQDKFRLRDLVPEKFTLSEMVIPTYDISGHLMKTLVNYMEKSITAIGGKVFFTVPENERWYINGYTVIFMGAGAFTLSGVYISRIDNLSLFFYLDLTAGQTISYTMNLPKSVLLDAGDRMGINIDGYTSPQNLRLYLDYYIEEIR